MFSRRRNWMMGILLATASLFDVQRIMSQAGTTASYRLRVPVDEVSLTFHAADAQGLPINDLKLNDIRLLDDGRPPARILDFKLVADSALRAGILIDVSSSMRARISNVRAIALQYAQGLARRQGDQTFLLEFGHLSKILIPWTGDKTALSSGIRQVTAGGEGRVAGTAIFDTLAHTCRYQFGDTSSAASSNFILLFSDGVDNASYGSLKDAAEICEETNTAIYAFQTDSDADLDPTGPRNLIALTSQTGGRVFHEDGSSAEINRDLGILESDLRNEYRLVYKPAGLAHDGRFHSVAMLPPDRVSTVNIRSGYYTPSH